MFPNPSQYARPSGSVIRPETTVNATSARRASPSNWARACRVTPVGPRHASMSYTQAIRSCVEETSSRTIEQFEQMVSDRLRYSRQFKSGCQLLLLKFPRRNTGVDSGHGNRGDLG